MGFRDEGDAILERVRALTRELQGARQEIDTLRRQLAGDPEPGPRIDPPAASIIDELSSARALLAGLIEDEDAEALADPIDMTPRPAPPEPPGAGVLRRVLKTILVRKLGAISSRVRASIDESSDVEALIEQIVEVALAHDEADILDALDAPPA